MLVSLQQTALVHAAPPLRPLLRWWRRLSVVVAVVVVVVVVVGVIIILVRVFGQNVALGGRVWPHSRHEPITVRLEGVQDVLAIGVDEFTPRLPQRVNDVVYETDLKGNRTRVHQQIDFILCLYYTTEMTISTKRNRNCKLRISGWIRSLLKPERWAPAYSWASTYLPWQTNITSELLSIKIDRLIINLVISSLFDWLTEWLTEFMYHLIN